MHELSVTILIAAPPEKVWDVLVNRQEDWFCPAPWQAKVVEQDRRPGGACRMSFHGPDGEQMPQEGVYIAWEEGRMFATTDAFTPDLVPSGPFMIGIWQIEPEDGGTRYTAKARHWTQEAHDSHKDMGFVEGWQACADQLKKLCEAD